jgi:Mycoplasma protein of unknown function, DUF285
MRAAFYEASSFDHALSSWDVMFNRADYFNQPLSTWDVSNAKQMSYMFFGAFFFGQNLCDWGSLVNVSDTPEVDVTGLLEGVAVKMPQNHPQHPPAGANPVPRNMTKIYIYIITQSLHLVLQCILLL